MNFEEVRKYVKGVLTNSFSNKETLDKLSENDGTLLFNGEEIKGGGGGSPYKLPIASADVLGGIKVGENLEINEDGVLSAIGGGSSSAISLESYADKYSEKERIIGSWINGKPLYQITKKYNITSLKNEFLIPFRYEYINWSFSSVNDNVINKDYTDLNSDLTSGYQIYIDNLTNKIKIQTTEEKYLGLCYVTFKYTKEEDTINSFNPNMLDRFEGYNPTIYSTEECVIGMWTNGKPIYQKVLSVNGRADTIKDIVLIEKVDKLINSRAKIGYSPSQPQYTVFDGATLDNGGFHAGLYAYYSDNDNNLLCTTASINFDGIYVDFVILQYTKTTDEENTFTPSMLYKDFLSDSEIAAAIEQDKEVL